jgi:hypothetical protein
VAALIADILAIPSQNPGPSQFQFNLDLASAIHNGKIVEAHNFHLASAIRSHGPSPLSFGSKFRPALVLEPLLGLHPLWPCIQDMLRRGSHFSADSLPPDDCLPQVDAALAYGNHKGAVNDPDTLYDLLDGDVTHGFNMPLPLSFARKIKGLLISPMNIARQETSRRYHILIFRIPAAKQGMFETLKIPTRLTTPLNTTSKSQVVCGCCGCELKHGSMLLQANKRFRFGKSQLVVQIF